MLLGLRNELLAHLFGSITLCGPRFSSTQPRLIGHVIALVSRAVAAEGNARIPTSNRILLSWLRMRHLNTLHPWGILERVHIDDVARTSIRTNSSDREITADV
jgi:hypothetical protein